MISGYGASGHSAPGDHRAAAVLGKQRRWRINVHPAGKEPGRGRHRRLTGYAVIPAGQSKRIVRFAAVGLSVMVIGIVIMVVLVDLFHVNKNVAYLFQSFITVEMNFFLNSFITWPGGTKNRLWKSWLRFHGFKVFTLVSSQVLFAAFLLGIQWLNLGAISVVKRLDYILAFLGCTAVITVINFLGNDHWVFSPAGSSGAD